ncbi:MAG TPA: helix-turn-helix transcriptional regulator [Anaerolineae bacterium]|nr:helix-turn-helix transcriptional regulator [Anaerolineae bacterium]
MKGMADKLIIWLSDELKRRGWSHRELARRAEISQTAVSTVVSGERKPGWDFCAAIARALGEPPETIMRMAELLPTLPKTGDSETIQKLVELVKQLPELAQRDVLDYAEWRYLQLQDEVPAESIKLLTAELERLFSLLTSSDRRSTLEQAALERRFRETIAQISRGAKG